jgi:hypothetical protein
MSFAKILGVVLILGGAVFLWKQPTYPASNNVVEVGDFKASIQGRKPLPLWIGAVAIGGGLLCLLMAPRERR